MTTVWLGVEKLWIHSEKHKSGKLFLFKKEMPEAILLLVLQLQTLTRTVNTVACIAKSKPHQSGYRRLSLSFPLSFSVLFVFSCSKPFCLLIFPPAWVSHSAQSCSWPQIRSIYIISPLPVEIHTSDIFSIQYPQAMFRCLINQITVT